MRSQQRTLNKFYNEFNFKDRLKHDPVEFPHRYTKKEDIEIAGFIAASFAYGKIGLFKPVIENIMKPGNKHPAEFIKNFDLNKDRKYVKGINYRFNKEKDVLCYIYMLGIALKEWGTLKSMFYNYYNPEDEDIKNALSGFTGFLLKINTSPVYGENIKPYGLKQLFPSPEKGSACKRMNLFLRWMIRDKDIDFGLWNEISPSKLIIPLDTHIAKISKCMGLTTRNSSDWKTAKEITESLKKYDPEDPVKYDFALCHHGISGSCKGKEYADVCAGCVFM